MTDYKALDTLALRIMDATVTDEDERKLGIDGITKVVQGRIVRLLRSALTPEWKAIPDALPEGAVMGLWDIGRGKPIKRIHMLERLSAKTVLTEWGYDPSHRQDKYRLIAAFDANGEVVR